MTNCHISLYKYHHPSAIIYQAKNQNLKGILKNMKITTFNPQIITRDSEAVIHFFEELGFEQTHVKEDIGDMRVKGIRMKHPDGFHVDISQNDVIPVETITSIRMNVDNFDEAYKILTARGFKNIYGAKTANAGSARSAMMFLSPGFSINIIEHIKS